MKRGGGGGGESHGKVISHLLAYYSVLEID